MPHSRPGWARAKEALRALYDYNSFQDQTSLQVLGGAGPAIAAVPLTVVWAGGAFYTLASGLGAGKVGPRGAVQRVGYTFFMAIADVSPLPISIAQQYASALKMGPLCPCMEVRESLL